MQQDMKDFSKAFQLDLLIHISLLLLSLAYWKYSKVIRLYPMIRSNSFLELLFFSLDGRQFSMAYRGLGIAKKEKA